MERENIVIAKKINRVKEIIESTPSIGVHPYTFEFLTFTLRINPQVPLTKIQQDLFSEYYIHDLSLTQLDPEQRNLLIILLRNGFDNLFLLLDDREKEKFSVNKIPIFKEHDVHLGTEEDKRIYSRAKRSLAHIGIRPSEETKKKISRAGTGRKNSPEAIEKMRQTKIGKVPSKETRKKRSESMTKKWQDFEYRKRISKALSEVWTRENYRKAQRKARVGKPVSDETRKKISEAKKGKTHTPEARRKMSEARRGKSTSSETKTKISRAIQGKRRSEETRKRMSESALRREQKKREK